MNNYFVKYANGVVDCQEQLSPDFERLMKLKVIEWILDLKLGFYITINSDTNQGLSKSVINNYKHLTKSKKKRTKESEPKSQGWCTSFVEHVMKESNLKEVIPIPERRDFSSVMDDQARQAGFEDRRRWIRFLLKQDQYRHFVFDRMIHYQNLPKEVNNGRINWVNISMDLRSKFNVVIDNYTLHNYFNTPKLKSERVLYLRKYRYANENAISEND